VTAAGTVVTSRGCPRRKDRSRASNVVFVACARRHNLGSSEGSKARRRWGGRWAEVGVNGGATSECAAFRVRGVCHTRVAYGVYVKRHGRDRPKVS